MQKIQRILFVVIFVFVGHINFLNFEESSQLWVGQKSCIFKPLLGGHYFKVAYLWMFASKRRIKDSPYCLLNSGGTLSSLQAGMCTFFVF